MILFIIEIAKGSVHNNNNNNNNNNNDNNNNNNSNNNNFIKLLKKAFQLNLQCQISKT